MALKGRFRIKNPSKYRGDPSNIIYRSSWEARVMHYLDNNPSILEWASEEFWIAYYDPVQKRERRYYPDFYVKAKTPEGQVKFMIIEVKPEKETRPPVRGKRSEKYYLSEQMTWTTNSSKWKAASDYCYARGWEFRLMTEKDIFPAK